MMRSEAPSIAIGISIGQVPIIRICQDFTSVILVEVRNYDWRALRTLDKEVSSEYLYEALMG